MLHADPEIGPPIQDPDGTVGVVAIKVWRYREEISSAFKKATNVLCMDIQHLYEALTSPTPPPHLEPAGTPFQLATHLSLLQRMEGVPLMGLTYTAADLCNRFPHDVVPLHAQPIFKKELSRYRGWRRALFDLYLLDMGRPADMEDIAALMRIARLEFITEKPSELSILRKILPANRRICDLNAESALALDKSLDPKDRPPFRRALSVIDQLQTAQLAQSVQHLLPTKNIGQLPAPSSHVYHAPLPPKLATEFADGATLLKAAMPFAYRFALHTGALSNDDDPTLNELALRLKPMFEIDPAEHGFRSPTKATFQTYIRHIWKYSSLGPYIRDSTLSPIQEAWVEFRRQIRLHGKTEMIHGTHYVSKHAVADGLAPHELNPEWFQGTDQRLSDVDRRAFRSGAFVIDALIQCDDLPGHLLPRHASGIKRMRKKPIS
ncbi:MAG: hypothetical protein ACSHWZ_14550 [Sulfitobacter sp.]